MAQVNFSDTFSAATAIQVGAGAGAIEPPRAVGSTAKLDAAALLFGARAPALGPRLAPALPPPPSPLLTSDVDKLKDSVSHANEMTGRYGVEVLSINIISVRLQ